MIGQMIMVGFAGTEVNDPGVVSARDQLGEGTIGGVVLYPENIRSPQQITALTAFLRNARSSPVPFIAVDQEGGKVQRLSRENGHSYFPSARSVGQNPSFATPDSAQRLYASMAKELADFGLQPQFRTGGRSQSQSGKSRDRRARPELRRRSQHRYRSRPRLHPRPSRRGDRHRRQAFSWPRLEPHR